MKKISLLVSAIAITAIFSECTKNKTGPNTNATVMFVNGCAGTTGIYTKVNGNNVGPSSINFFANSGYQNVTASSSVGINFYLTNLGTSLINGTPALTAGSHYSVFAGGIITSPSFVPVADDLTSPTSGNAKIRFINLSSDNLNESFSVGTQTVDSNILYTHCSPYYQVTAGAYVIKAVDPSNIPAAVITPSTTLGAGKIYTVMLTGSQSASSGSTSGLTLTIINNN